MQRRSFLRQGAMLGLGGALGRLAAAESVQPAAAGSGQPAPAGGLRTLRSLDEVEQADGRFAETIVKAVDLGL